MFPFLNQNQSYNYNCNDNIHYNQNEEQYMINSNEDYNLYPNEGENCSNLYSESEEKDEKKWLSDSSKNKDINNEEKNNPEKLHDGNALVVHQMHFKKKYLTNI